MCFISLNTFMIISGYDRYKKQQIRNKMVSLSENSGFFSENLLANFKNSGEHPHRL